MTGLFHSLTFRKAFQGQSGQSPQDSKNHSPDTRGNPGDTAVVHSSTGKRLEPNDTNPLGEAEAYEAKIRSLLSL